MKELLRFAVARLPGLYHAAVRVLPERDPNRRVFMHLVRDGDTVLDVGANLGWYTLLFSHQVGRAGRVVAFEPVPATADRLRQRLADHGRFDNVELVRAALSDRQGSAEMHLPDDDHGQASLQPHRHGAWHAVDRVHRHRTPVLTLDGWSRDRPVERLDFVKVDIEGAELPALRGGRELIRRHRPVLFLEVYDEWARSFGYRPRDLVALLRELGYDRLWRLDGELSPLPPDHDADELGELLSRRPQNLLCLCSASPEHTRRAAPLLRSLRPDDP